jgi:hypothetical protein
MTQPALAALAAKVTSEEIDGEVLVSMDAGELE